MDQGYYSHRTIDGWKIMLDIHLFGHLRLFIDGQVVRWAALPKTQLLLAYLLLHRQEAIARDRLAFLLWDDVPESEARANLRRHLHDLNKTLPLAPPAVPWLLRVGTTIQWNPSAPFWLDIAEFEARCEFPHQLAEAVTLYTGDLLPHLYDDWLSQERERLQMRYLNALMQLIERMRQQGDLRQALMYAQMLLNYDSLREDAVREMMLLRYEVGDRSGAVQVYQRFAERLAEELDLSPMLETVLLYETISQNKPWVDTNKVPPEIKPAAEDITAVSPPHNLPAQLTPFIGRREEIAAVSRLIGLAESPTRLVTITGPGGTGKTRLSLQVADGLRHQQPTCFPDGTYFVELSSLTEPSQVVTAVAEALAVHEQNGRSLLECLKEALQTKRLLLILDNFEHLLAAAVEVADLLTAGPGLRLLITSQAALHLYGEYEFPLAPLPLPQPDQTLSIAELLNYAAIALFVARVQAVQPGFVLSEANRDVVVTICHRLDGMPLALELAAARSKLFTPATMLAQLGQRLPFLTSQERNRPSRQQTLRATIDWSYNLLTADEQIGFAGLALFADSFTFAAAESLFGEPGLFGTSPPQAVDEQLPPVDIMHLLTSLVDKSMLRALPAEGAEEPRFRMLQTLREYGLEKLTQMAPETAAALQRRFAAYYTVLAEQGMAALRSAGQQAWIQRLHQEKNNFIVALNWLYTDDNRSQSGLQLAGIVSGLSRFWTLQGHLRELQFWLDCALTYLPLLPPLRQIQLLNEAGNAAQIRGDYTAAENWHQKALSLANELNDERQIAFTLHFVAYATGRQGHYAEAKKLFQECLARYRGLPDIKPIQLTGLLNNLAIVHKRLGEYQEAVTLLEETITVKRANDDQIGLPASLSNLANLLILQGCYTEAAAQMHEALTIRQQLQDSIGLGYSLEQMGNLALAQGQYGRAATLYAAADTQLAALAVPRPVDGQIDYETAMNELRQQLDAAEMIARQQIGINLSMAEAVTYALQDTLPT